MEEVFDFYLREQKFKARIYEQQLDCDLVEMRLEYHDGMEWIPFKVLGYWSRDGFHPSEHRMKPWHLNQLPAHVREEIQKWEETPICTSAG